MKQKAITRIIVSALAGVVLTLGTVITGAAGPSPQTPAKGGGGIRTAIHPETGKLSFIGAEPGAPIAVRGAVGEGIAPSLRAEAVLAAYAPQFGVANPQRDLTLTRETAAGGRQIVRYRQEYQGIPVLGGELTLNMNSGGLISMNGEISPDLSLPTEPAISAEQARQRAIAAVAKYYDLDASELTASEPALWIYDPRLLVGRSPIPPHLVWRMDVTAAGRPIRELVLIDALRGRVSLSFNQIDTFWGEQAARRSGQAAKAAPASVQPAPPAVLGTPDLWTYDSGGTNGQRVSLVCHNNARGCSSGEAANAHGYAYDTYQAYDGGAAPFTADLNRDSIDGAGLSIISNVNWNETGYCPNAFWDGDEMTYCTGLAADDVVAHELTHGVTQYESNLFYFYESGAINESLSDIWGEYVDQLNGYGSDSSTVKWKMGEDAAGMGVIRDMKNPPAYGQPDSMTSIYYYKGSGDNGGVHYNSGVNNKAAYLMVDGGSFNGKTVSPLGWAKTITIYYEAQTNLLTSGSGYYDLYYALYQACLNKVGTAGITAADCQEVRDATDATKMNLEPASGFNPNAAACPAGMSVYQNLFTEDFETGADGWTFGTAMGSDNNWSLWSTTSWYPWWGPNAKDGVESLYADDDAGYFNDYTLNDSWAVSPNIVLPPSSRPYLLFSHWFGFEYYNAYNYDGGVLEYSTNGGATWTDASALFSGGQNYKGTISNGWGNPLGGRKAFVNASHGYVDSRYNLTSLAGQTVNFRWRMGTDETGAYWGWFLDAVQVNTCLGIPSVPTLQSPASNALVTDYTPTLNWSDSTGDLHHYALQIDDNSDFSSPVLDVSTAGTASEYTPASDLPSNAKLYWRVRSVNAAGGASAWTALRYFRSAMLPPNSVSPGNVYPPGPEEQLLTRRPTFDWDAVAGAASYTLEVSTTPSFATKAINKTVNAPASEYTHTSDLAANTIYYWRVKANGVNGPSLYSQVRQFRTANPPSVPNLSSPGNNALLPTLTPTLMWNKSTVPTGTTFRWYELQIDTSSAFGSAVSEFTDEFDVNDANFITDPLLNGTTYYWRVRAFNTAGEYSGWSAVRSFRIPYAGPALNLPLDTATGVSRKPYFEWNAIPGAASYTLQVSTSPAFSTLAINKTIYAPAVSYTHTMNLLANTLYYWRVRANGTYGPGFWSSVFTFTTGP